MNREALKTILPHRHAMLLLDEADYVDGIAYGKKKIRADEWFLNGHFPQHPVVPGVILCEIMAQSMAATLVDEVQGSCLTLLTGMDKVRFRQEVHPEEVFETKCQMIREKAPFYFAKGEGYVNGTLCVTAEFSFLLMPQTEESHDDTVS